MLRIDRKPGQKLRLRGKVHGTITIQLCNSEMRSIYNTSVIARLELKNMAQVFIPVYCEKWTKFSDMELRQNGDGVTILVHSSPDELQVLRAELINRVDAHGD